MMQALVAQLPRRAGKGRGRQARRRPTTMSRIATNRKMQRHGKLVDRISARRLICARKRYPNRYAIFLLPPPHGTEKPVRAPRWWIVFINFQAWRRWRKIFHLLTDATNAAKKMGNVVLPHG